jgi:hypothetical protein
VTVKLLLSESGGREKSEVIKWQYIGEYVKDPFKKTRSEFLGTDIQLERRSALS